MLIKESASDSRHDILHQQGKALGVVDHRRRCAVRTRLLPALSTRDGRRINTMREEPLHYRDPITRVSS